MYHPRLKGNHYDMGRHYDRLGEMFVAECTAEQVSVRWCEKYAAATNRFVIPAMQRYNAEGENWYQTRDRLAWGMNKAKRK